MYLPGLFLLYPVLWVTFYAIGKKWLLPRFRNRRSTSNHLLWLVPLSWLASHMVMRGDNYWGAIRYYLPERQKIHVVYNDEKKYRGALIEPLPEGDWIGSKNDLESLGFFYWEWLYEHDLNRENEWVDILIKTPNFRRLPPRSYSQPANTVTICQDGKPVAPGIYRARPIRSTVMLDNRGKPRCDGNFVAPAIGDSPSHDQRCFKISITKIDRSPAEVLVRELIQSCHNHEGKYQVCRSSTTAIRRSDDIVVLSQGEVSYSGGWLDKWVFDGKEVSGFSPMVWKYRQRASNEQNYRGWSTLLRHDKN